jgi:DtxR family transcriptional regulator, Mn-dependent transcriptional regulator
MRWSVLDAAESHNLTPALEDYLESIYQLVRDSGFARIRDIARARNVRAASVTPAMRRLDDLGLIRYERREYVVLTPQGEDAARRVFGRHQLLSRFFATFLGLGLAEAESNACAVEHVLSPAAIDKLARYFEFIEMCPDASSLVAKFRQCSLVQDAVPECSTGCPVKLQTPAMEDKHMSIADLEPGQSGRIRQVGGGGIVRQRLLDMGILPNAVVEMARRAPTGDPVWIRMQGFELALRQTEAAAVQVETL